MLAVVGVLVLVGGGTAVVLLNGKSAPPAPTTSSEPPEPEWPVVEDTQAGVAYQVPPSWKSGGGGASGRVRLTQSRVSRPFECQGRSMIQAQVASGSVIDDDLADVATTVARDIAKGGYTVEGRQPELAGPDVRGDEERTVVSFGVTPRAVNPCFAPKATVTAVALRNGPKATVVVLNVAEGGPHAAEGPGEEEADRILESVRLL
ncbi:hypothetical protein FHS29_002216 [Saccharothrix tamanrassetensis]|uniref:DUF8017 domain-containing protein n=1 Tax=Saccharothrix tamanrassetensis TaxID=1051531 RepID=A0A841CI00_9PSEU|nr:hypothetical protein [Saccharothrix tamanrassetensis]MBB5955635.1 hypothetical protein [Saccharothrix tamanrassetensis]